MYKKKKKNKIKRNKIFKIIFKLLIVFYLILISTKFTSTILSNFKKETELTNLKNELSNKINENQKIQHQLNVGITDDYALARARNELNFVDPLERIFFDVTVE